MDPPPAVLTEIPEAFPDTHAYGSTIHNRYLLLSGLKPVRCPLAGKPERHYIYWSS